MTSLDEALNALAPADGWHANWDDVLVRARARRLSRRLLVLAAAVAVAVVVPLVALSAINDWWFFKYGAAPAPTHAPVVVKTGDWGGHRWELAAYPTVKGWLCVSMNPVGEKGSFGAAMGCADLPITYLAGGPSSVLPGYVVGPVKEAATRVRIVFTTGRSVTVPAFAGPPPLDRIKFYVARADASVFPRLHRGRPPAGPILSLAGLDDRGQVVACLVPAHATRGHSALAACR